MVVGRVRLVVILCSVNTTKYYLGEFVSGRYEVGRFIEMVFKTGSTIYCESLFNTLYIVIKHRC